MARSKQIATTTSGKPIMATFSNPAHDSFSAAEHIDAAAVHLYLFRTIEGKSADKHLDRYNDHKAAAGGDDALSSLGTKEWTSKRTGKTHTILDDDAVVAHGECLLAAPEERESTDYDKDMQEWLAKEERKKERQRHREWKKLTGRM